MKYSGGQKAQRLMKQIEKIIEKIGKLNCRLVALPDKLFRSETAYRLLF